MIVKNKQITVLGNIYEENGFDSAGGRVYDRGGILCNISATTYKHTILILVENERHNNDGNA